ncbi:PREDICTED: arylphorin subunit beta-like [Polistes dominula]|uniref:Arylphorin subunit beta-like n=1 Tax=Polistes dominula TaxID=743375 RepID=A0ABM1ICK5_POLDO|nr:PREDICTED: arylphorin subunit beta-like [Polistes dominula]
MYRNLVVLAVLAFCLVSAEYYTVQTADKVFLLKQKKIYNLLYHISQPDIVNPDLYTEGQQYSIEANIDSYTNQDAVKEFLYLYKHGMLPRGNVFSVYYPKVLKESIALFRLFYYAKDFDVFYKTALWARIYINEGQFAYALYNAVIRRPDTVYIQLPPLYEMYPYAFFNSEVLQKANHAKVFGKLDSQKSLGYDTYIIPANYSGWYYKQEYDGESKLNYFTEDIGLNLYYFYFRQQYPFWLKSEEFEFPVYRGEEYLYGHKQIMARYHLERLSNGLEKVEDFDWSQEFYPGYYPTLTYHNGLPFVQRPRWSTFPFYKYKYIKDVREMESRITGAIDSGFVWDKNAKMVNINSPNGINILGNLIEGNADSFNYDFYGSLDYYARKILGYNVEPATPYQIIPSALEDYATSLRDPAFYRLYKRIIYYYYRYKVRQEPYTKDMVVFPSFKVESFAVDKLSTYFDQFDTSLNNGLVVESQKEAESYVIKARQYRLNHKPFNFHITINSEKSAKVAIRIFLGPKYDARHRLLNFEENFKYFYQIDNWILDLNAGINKIDRSSKDCYYLSPDPEPGEVFYKKIEKALDGSETLKYNERVYGFPERLLLPKGKPEGFPLRMFIYVSPVLDEPKIYSSRIFGDYKFDDKPAGFPLDKPTVNFHYDGSNMLLKDVFVFHKDETEKF